MKRIFLILIVAFMIFVLVACAGQGSVPESVRASAGDTAASAEDAAGDGSAASGDGSSSVSAVSGSRTYDTGVLTVTVPEGWQEFAVNDLFSETAAVDPTQVHVYKGASAEDDMYIFMYPGLQITYFEDPSAVIFPDDEAFEAVYDNIEYIDDVVAGSHTFTAYTCTSEDVPQTMMWNAEEGLQICMVTEMGGESISLDDPDVMNILASITVK